MRKRAVSIAPAISTLHVTMLALQHSFPAMGQAQPKFAVCFAGRRRCLGAALLDLFLKKIARFDHSYHHSKMPRFGGAPQLINATRRCLFRRPNEHT
jgi:hypothetical protein